mmetsp:Transcript_61016/g.72418  ORF Transcript_61016/g.72418 Transcript_61016/m.72418 type:complete len:291 (+) Transcript_61016:1613-2485(+)
MRTRLEYIARVTTVTMNQLRMQFLSLTLNDLLSTICAKRKNLLEKKPAFAKKYIALSKVLMNITAVKFINKSVTPSLVTMIRNDITTPRILAMKRSTYDNRRCKQGVSAGFQMTWNKLNLNTFCSNNTAIITARHCDSRTMKDTSGGIIFIPKSPYPPLVSLNKLMRRQVRDKTWIANTNNTVKYTDGASSLEQKKRKLYTSSGNLNSACCGGASICGGGGGGFGTSSSRRSMSKISISVSPPSWGVIQEHNELSPCEVVRQLFDDAASSTYNFSLFPHSVGPKDGTVLS